MTSSSSPKIDRSELRQALEDELSSHFQSPQRIVSLGRRISPYSSSCPIQNLRVELAGGKSLDMVLKDTSPDSLLPQARRVRPKFLYHPLREVEAYRQFLDPVRFGTPIFYGVVNGADSRRRWLLLERVKGPLLWQLGEMRSWQQAAAWLARLHSEFDERHSNEVAANARRLKLQLQGKAKEQGGFNKEGGQLARRSLPRNFESSGEQAARAPFRVFLESALADEENRASWRRLLRFSEEAPAGPGNSKQTGAAPGSHLLIYNSDFYYLWIAQAECLVTRARFRSSPEARRTFRRLADAYDRVVATLLAMPRTFIHGEFYPSNIIVRSSSTQERICPVDWEVAGFAPGLVDLAALTSGKWTDEQRRIMVASYREALVYPSSGTPAMRDLMEAVDYCQLHLSVQWLGWAAEWSPPAQHAQDWLQEACRLADRLGLTRTSRGGARKMHSPWNEHGMGASLVKKGQNAARAFRTNRISVSLPERKVGAPGPARPVAV